MNNYCSVFLGFLFFSLKVSGQEVSVERANECENCVSSSMVQAVSESSFLSPDKRGKRMTANLSLVDQNGSNFTFTKPTVITFVYTRCSNINRCPKTARDFFDVYNQLKEKDSVDFLIMTYDPVFDTPDVLNAYAKSMEIQPTESFRFVCASRNQTINFFSLAAVKVSYGQGGSVGMHKNQTILFDDKGRTVKQYEVLTLKNSNLIADIANLLAE